MLTQAQKKHIKKLQQKKYRWDTQSFLVEGVKGSLEALMSGATVLQVVVEDARADGLDIVDIVQKAEEQGVEVVFCEQKDINTIKTTETFPGVLAVIEIPVVKREDLINHLPIVCLDRVTDPGNLGTIIRTADWFGVPNVLLSEDSVDVFNPKVVRSTMGSLFHTTVFESSDILATLHQLKEDGYRIIALSTEGKLVKDGEFTDPKSVFVFGSESHGIRKDLVDLASEMYSIQGDGRAESLNVAVSAGIVLSHISRK